MSTFLLRLFRSGLWLTGFAWAFLVSLPAHAAGTSALQLTTNTRNLFGGLQSQCQPTGQAGSTQMGPALSAYCQSATQSTAQQAGDAQAQAFANEQQASHAASNAAAGTSNNLNAQNQTSGMNSTISQVKNGSAQSMKEMAQQLAQHAQGLQQYIQMAEQEADQLASQGQQMVSQGQMMQQFTPTYGNGVMMENLGKLKLEQAQDLRKFAGDVDSNVKAKYDAEAPQYEARAGEDLAEAGKLGDNSSTASTNGQGMEALGQMAKGMGGGEGGGKGGSSAGPSGVSTSTGKTDSIRLADSATRGTSSASMADPSDFFKKSNDFSAGFGSGAKSSPASTSTASIANLKEKLQAERAARSAAAASDGGAGGAAGGATGANGAAMGPEGASMLASISMPGGSGLGDMGLSIGMGDPKFDDAMKGLLGLESGSALSEEEKAMLASRELASLSGSGFEPLPPEVLGAESASLFERTKGRIVVSLKQGKILSGLSSKLK